MNFEEYQEAASLTALYPNSLKNLEYPTLGLAGEAYRLYTSLGTPMIIDFYSFCLFYVFVAKGD